MQTKRYSIKYIQYSKARELGLYESGGVLTYNYNSKTRTWTADPNFLVQVNAVRYYNATCKLKDIL